MTHVELSLSKAFPAQVDPAKPADHSFTIWLDTVALATEPCLVIDDEMTIAAASASCCRLLGLGTQTSVVGRPLLDGGLRLVDFTAARGELTEAEIDKIPPLLALTSGRLARGLLRVQTAAPGEKGEKHATFDAVATPLMIDGTVAGSLTFFCEV